MSYEKIAKELIVGLEEYIDDMERYMRELIEGLIEYQKEYNLTIEELYTKVCWKEQSDKIFSYIFG